MNLSSVIDAMLEAGCTAEQMAAVVRKVEAEREQKAIERRANDAQRQRRHRMSRDVTVTPRDERDTLSPLVPPSFLPPTPPNQTPPYNPPTPENPPSPTAQTPRGSTSRGSRLPEDFGLTPELLAYAGSKGLTEVHAADCLAEMREWAEANANRPVARKADWNLALQGWMRRKAQDLARAGPRRAESRAASFWGSDLAKAAE